MDSESWVVTFRKYCDFVGVIQLHEHGLGGQDFLEVGHDDFTWFYNLLLALQSGLC